jgi:hypothetical protein
MKKGIVLVANLKSQSHTENLIYSIRESGCQLPIRLIHFGGDPVNSKYILDEVEFLTFDDFSEEAKAFINNLRSVLTDCPMGFLYRFLAWYSDWNEFIYSDNDIVALMNWERLFDFTEGYDLVHADKEYATKGIFNYNKPQEIEFIFGEDAHISAITAGHIVVKKDEKMIADINSAVIWFKENPEIPKKHDQSLLHIASLLGNWKLLNLCKEPYNWLSTWSGDYANSLDLIQVIQGSYLQKTVLYEIQDIYAPPKPTTKKEAVYYQNTLSATISHIHYSGRSSTGNMSIDDLLYSSNTDSERINNLFKIKILELFFINDIKKISKRIKGRIKRMVFVTK